jgi:hypothetical protein
MVRKFTTKKKGCKDDIDKILQLADALPRFAGTVETNHWMARQLQIKYENYELEDAVEAAKYNKHFKINADLEERLRVQMTPVGQHWLRNEWKRNRGE